LNDNTELDPRVYAIPDIHGHAKGEHKPYTEERPLPLTARMLFLWFYHACRRGYPRFLMVADHMNYLTFEDPAAVNLVRRALKLAQAGDLYGAAETANVDVAHAAVVSEGLRRGMRYSIGAEVDNDPRSRPDAQNIVDAMRPDGIIRSVHFLPITHPVHGDNWSWPFDNPEFQDLFEVVGVERTWELYVNALVDAIERLPGHIVGHFFVPAVFGHWPEDAKLDGHENRVLDAAEARGMAVEFNTRFFYRDHSDEEKDRYLDANQRFLRKAKARGVPIAVGSDAHSPKDQGGAFEVALHVLDALDINEIVFPLAGQLRRVALRVVREPEPEPVPEPPAPEPAPVAPATVPAAAARPVRKARATAASTRPPATSPERPPERPETSAAAAEPPAEPPRKTPAKRKEPPPTAEPAASAPVPEKTKPAPKAAAKVPPPAKPAAPKATPKPAVRPQPHAPKRSAPKPVAVTKPAKKVTPARGPAKKAAPARKSAPAKKPAPAKKTAPAKKAALAKKVAPKKSAPAKKSVPAKKSAPARKPLPAKKAAPAKKLAKKAATARTVPKKPAPKKPPAKKPAPARTAPVRKSAAGKKTTAKKTAHKRR
jgi:HisJ family histidinol phosphate phosphatase